MQRFSLAIGLGLALGIGPGVALGDSPAIGEPAPAIGLEELLQAPDGTTADWESLRGKVVVLEFWATWCGPCVAAIPHLNEVAEKTKDKSVQFISITDENAEVINKFLARKPIKSWIGLDTDRSMHDAFGVKGIPRTFIVGPDGKLVADTMADAVTEEVLTAVLAGEKVDVPNMSQMPPGAIIMAGVDPGNASETPLYQVTIRKTDRKWGGTVTSRGRVTAEGVTLSSIVAMAYAARQSRIVCPAALDEQAYTLIINVPQERQDRWREQLQSALSIAFGVRVTPETRETDCYVLAVPEGVEPTLSPAVSTASGGRWSKGYFSGTGQTGEELTKYFESVLGVPVVDEAHLGGHYDVMLKYDGDNVASLVDALRETLGLSLTKTTRPVEVLVIVPE